METRPRRGRPREIDRDAFHKYLWDRRDRKNCVEVVQKTLAEALGVSGMTIRRTTDWMVAQGRATYVKDRRILQLTDPSEATAERVPRGERKVMWG